MASPTAAACRIGALTEVGTLPTNNMAKQTLFAYVQGTDLDDVAGALEARLDAFHAEHTWRLDDVWVVNQRTPTIETKAPASEWDLGFNLTLPAPKKRPADWVQDVLAIAKVFGVLHNETQRAFVIGIHDAKTDKTQDLFVVDAERPDLEKLKAVLTSATE